MTTIQSPSHALGLMVIGRYNDIANVLPQAMMDTDGPRRIYPLIKGLDAMLYSYRDKMHYAVYHSVDKKISLIKYYDKIIDLEQRRQKLRFGNPNHLEKWVEWFHEYMVLLSSCFNQIGLAPAKIMDDIDWNEQPYIPPEYQSDTESTDQEVSD